MTSGLPKAVKRSVNSVLVTTCSGKWRAVETICAMRAIRNHSRMHLGTSYSVSRDLTLSKLGFLVGDRLRKLHFTCTQGRNQQQAGHGPALRFQIVWHVCSPASPL